MARLVNNLCLNISKNALVNARRLSITDKKLIHLSHVFHNGGNEYYDIKSLVTNDIEEIIKRSFAVSSRGHQVYVVQPYIKWGRNRVQNTNPSLQLGEAIALVKSLNDWEVVDSEQIGLLSYKRSTFFGPGQLEELAAKVKQSNAVSAVYVNYNMLTSVQHACLENELQMAVYDKYLVVMNIFRQHAVSAEAKLQVAMAEIPYMWKKINYTNFSSCKQPGGIESAIGGIGVSPTAFHDTRKDHIQSYEKKLKQSINKLRLRREYSRVARKNNEFPIIAVVGYTNSGKTSLIKALTGSKTLQPKNRLFATLDVTFHEGYLPCNVKVLYVDTIGFISDIPTDLIEPFRVTLQDAMNADLIIHVEDISHPDIKLQRMQVTKTLKQLEIENNLLDRIITVSNKVDLINPLEPIDVIDDSFLISCMNQTGIDKLQARIETEILKCTGRIKLIIRVKTGGSEMDWLKDRTAVTSIMTDNNNVNYSLMNIITTNSTLDQFKHRFIGAKRKT